MNECFAQYVRCDIKALLFRNGHGTFERACLHRFRGQTNKKSMKRRSEGTVSSPVILLDAVVLRLRKRLQCKF